MINVQIHFTLSKTLAHNESYRNMRSLPNIVNDDDLLHVIPDIAMILLGKRNCITTHCYFEFILRSFLPDITPWQNSSISDGKQGEIFFYIVGYQKKKKDFKN